MARNRLHSEFAARMLMHSRRGRALDYRNSPQRGVINLHCIEIPPVPRCQVFRSFRAVYRGGQQFIELGYFSGSQCLG